MKKTVFIILLIIFSSFSCKHLEEEKIINISDQIEKANRNYRKIKSINYEKISSFLTNSTLFYEKPNKIMFETYYFNKKKLQIICDGVLFWFWIEQFDKKNAYYSKLEEINKTRLKKSLYPEVLRGLIWVDEIKECKIENDELVIIKKYCTIKLRLKEGKVISQKFEINSIPIITVTTEEFQEINNIFVPQKIKVEWHEEKRKETIFLGKANLNGSLEIKIPKEPNKINLNEN